MRPRQLLSEPSLPEPEWYLAVAPAFPVVQEFDRHREWAEELSQALHSFQGRFLEQLFVWKWDLSSQAFCRVAEQGLVPVFYLSRENLAAGDRNLTQRQYEAEARRQLADMKVSVSRANSQTCSCRSPFPFPKAETRPSRCSGIACRLPGARSPTSQGPCLPTLRCFSRLLPLSASGWRS